MFEWIATTIQQNPDFLAVLLGTLSAYALGLLLELYVIPSAWSKRSRKGTSALCDIVVGAGLTMWIWYYLDPSDSFGMRLSVALAAAQSSTIIYPIIGRWIGKKLSSKVTSQP